MARTKKPKVEPFENWSIQELVEYCSGKQLHALLHGEKFYDAMYQNVLIVLNWKSKQKDD